MRLEWTEPAVIDLGSVHEYVALESPLTARRLVERIFRAVEKLEQFPLDRSDGPRGGPGVPVTVLRRAGRQVRLATGPDRRCRLMRSLQGRGELGRSLSDPCPCPCPCPCPFLPIPVGWKLLPSHPSRLHDSGSSHSMHSRVAGDALWTPLAQPVRPDRGIMSRQVQRRA
jgi:plasmid stabilization system protein ParE